MSNIVLGSKVIVTSSLQVFTQAERAFNIFIILLSLVTILGIQKEHVSVSSASSAIEFLLQVTLYRGNVFLCLLEGPYSFH